MARAAFCRIARLATLREVLSRLAWRAFAFAALSLGAQASAADAPARSVEIAVSLPLSGEEASYGEGALLGIKLAIEEANANGATPRIDLNVLDDKGSDDEAKAVAERIVAGKAALMLGPAFSTASLMAGPVYAQPGLAALSPTATSDAITDNPTTFRVIFKNSEQGVILANYLSRVLNQRKADVIVVDNKYGKTLQAGFEGAAKSLPIDAQYFVFSTPEEIEAITRVIAGDASQPAVVILTLDSDAADILTALRRFGAKGAILGGDALGDEVLSTHFTGLAEERREPGYFNEGVYAITPVILDSANADTLAFANRFRARFGRDPVWQTVASYDTAVLGVAAARAALAETGADRDVNVLRKTALAYLNALDNSARALPGLLGPLSFDGTHGRQQAVRIGQFHGGHFESAPLQLVPVTAPDASELTSGIVFELEPGRFARLQRVVYTGVFVNEIPRVDITRASFGADFYLWLRFARNAGPASPDPTRARLRHGDDGAGLLRRSVRRPAGRAQEPRILLGRRLCGLAHDPRQRQCRDSRFRGSLPDAYRPGALMGNGAGL
jgi:branched-chain amino acid transport system substrate-binding protein